MSSEPSHFEVRLSQHELSDIRPWLVANEREHHFVRIVPVYPHRRGDTFYYPVIVNDRSTAIMLKLALA